MPLSLRVLALWCGTATCVIAGSQDLGQAPDVQTLVARASAYTTSYLTTMSGLLGEEHYRQESPAAKMVEAPPADGMRPHEYTIPGQRRDLRSEILILKSDTLLGWRVFRDVFEVDGRSIHDRQTRLGRLFLEPAATAMAQAQRIDQEGARFNISDVGRTLNLPGLPLLFLQEPIKSRFKFALENVVVETGTIWVLAFQETTRPTIFRHNVRSDNVSTGRIWMNTSGVVLRTEHALKPDRLSVGYVTEFAPSPEFGIALPTKMSERIRGDRRVDGEATYPIFRRFAVTTKDQIGVPAAPSGMPPSSPPAAATTPAGSPRDAGPEIPWSVDRLLTWDDFRGVPIAGGVEGARTVYLLSYDWRCRGADFTFGVKAVVLPLRSWVKPHVLASPAESRRVLGHEQTHFNLTETYARRIRKFLEELNNPCEAPEGQLRESVERFVREEGEAQRRYDDETGYGLNPQTQDRWNRDVGDKLSELAAFAN